METKRMTEFGKICRKAKTQANKWQAFANEISHYKLPHGFTIEQNLFYPASWSLLCNGNFVFQGSIDECFIAFGSHLAGVGK
jgi:hypothetical protein